VRQFEFHPNESSTPATEQLSKQEIGKLLDQLELLRSSLSAALGPSKEQGSVDEVVLERLAKKILRVRGRRSRIFGGGLFCDPAWDILLELYVAERSNRKLSVSGASYASAAPHTTGLRWVQRLEKDGLVRRMNDPTDLRRSWLVLTDEGSTKMRQILAEFTTSLF
jgi:hypothetical protein